MSTIGLIPCVNKSAQRHFEATVSNAVGLAGLEQRLLGTDDAALNGASTDGRIRLWGAKPGEDGRNEARWSRLSEGDYLLFFHGNDRVSIAGILHTFRNPLLARELWGEALTKNGVVQTWEYMFALAEPRDVSMPTSRLNELIGRKPNAAVQEFVVLGAAPSSAVIEDLGLVEKRPSPGEGVMPAPGRSSTVQYGHVPGSPVGAVFKSRREAYDAGVHRTTQAGIAGQSEGTQSICLSHGYSDDDIQGDLITYTGFGGRDPDTGRHNADQKLERGNLGLVENYKLGRPVRVLAKESVLTRRAGDADYIYLGLFDVVGWSWGTRDGYKVLIYQLRATSGDGLAPEDVAETLTRGADVPTQRRTSQVNRIVRNYDVAASVKRLYDNTCQICSARLVTAAGAYSEGAHIRPLGVPHNGSDTLDNILCLCPNCHALFDGHALKVLPDLRVLNLGDHQFQLTVHPAHQINADNLAYHVAISTELSKPSERLHTVEGIDDTERREVRSWMRQYCPDATIPESDAELLASILTSLLQHEQPLIRYEPQEVVFQSPLRSDLNAMLSKRTRCYVKFPRRAVTDLVGYAALAWEILKLVQGEPLDPWGASFAITAGAMERIRFLSKPELLIVAYVVVREKDSEEAIPATELQDHWPHDEGLFRGTLEKLVKRGVLVQIQDGYSLAA